MRNDSLPDEIINIVNSTSRKYNCAKMYLEETEKENYVILELDLKAYKDLTPGQLAEFENKEIFLESRQEVDNGREVFRFKIKPYEENRFAQKLSDMMMPFHTEYAYKEKSNPQKSTFKSDFDRKVNRATYPLHDLKI